MLLPSPSIRLLNRAQLTPHFIYLFCVRSDEYKRETPFFLRSSSSSMFMWVVMEPFEKSLAQGLPHDVAEGFFFLFYKRHPIKVSYNRRNSSSSATDVHPLSLREPLDQGKAVAGNSCFFTDRRNLFLLLPLLRNGLMTICLA